MGRIRSVDRVIIRKNGSPLPRKGQTINPVMNSQGRLMTGNRRQGWLLVHRAVLLAFVGSCPEGMEGCHNDGDMYNNVLSNLRWDTPKNNRADVIRHGNDPWLRRTHCVNGHEWNEENTLWYEAGHRRICRACKREWMRERRARERQP